MISTLFLVGLGRWDWVGVSGSLTGTFLFIAIFDFHQGREEETSLRHHFLCRLGDPANLGVRPGRASQYHATLSHPMFSEPIVRDLGGRGYPQTWFRKLADEQCCSG